MEYTIFNNEASTGGFIYLSHIAEAMARHEATDYGSSKLHEPTLENVRKNTQSVLIDAAKRGHLKVFTIEKISVCSESFDFDHITTDDFLRQHKTNAYCLNEWGKTRGDSFTVLDFPVEAVEKNGIRFRVYSMRFLDEQSQPSTADNHSHPATCTHACYSDEIIDGFMLDGKNWSDILSRPNRDGKLYKEALVLPGKKGRGQGGKSNQALWNPVIFARLLVALGELNHAQVKARFKKAWPQWQDELAAEMG